VDGDLTIDSNNALTGLDGLANLVSVDGSVTIGGFDDIFPAGNEMLTSLAGLASMASIGGGLEVSNNYVLPDCEACDLLGHITTGPLWLDVFDNLDDTCTPVPDNCP
jgi:hypothetical protein